MRRLRDEIDAFTEWMLDEEGSLAMHAALDALPGPTYFAQGIFDIHLDGISTYSPVAFVPEMLQYIRLAQNSCPGAPIPSEEALEAFQAEKPWLALQKEVPAKAEPSS